MAEEYARLKQNLEDGIRDTAEKREAWRTGDMRNNTPEEMEYYLSDMRYYLGENEYLYDEIADELTAEQKETVQALINNWNDAIEELDSEVHRAPSGGRRRRRKTRKTKRATRKSRKNRK